jgi:hypothetical protein
MNQEKRKAGWERGFSYFPIFLISCSFLFGACATTHKTYQPPPNAKLEASTKRLSEAVARASNATERVTSHVVAARKAADKEATSSATVLTQLEDLIKVLPPELKAKGDALKKAVVEDQGDIGEIVTHVDGAQTELGQLRKYVDEAKSADAQVKTDKNEYYRNAQKLANDATSEREARIKAESQLVKEKWIRILWRIGGGLIVALISGVVILYFTGKLGIVLAKVGIKAAV